MSFTRQLLLASSAAIVLLSIAGLARSAEPRSVASVDEVMKAMTVPASNAIWAVARTAPADDAAWETLQNQAVLLAESGNLLLIGDRAKDDEVWRETSLQMVEAGALALSAAKEKNADGINDAGNLMVDACEICHEKHWER